MKRLNHILQSNIIIIVLIVIIVLLVITIKSHSTIDNNIKSYSGIIENYKIDGAKLTIQIKGKERIISEYYISDKKEKDYLENNIIIGSKITVYGDFYEPSNNTIPNTFNYKKYLKSKNIYLIMNTNKYKLTNKCNIFYKFKNWLIKRIKVYKKKEYYFTFILGDKNYLDTNTYDNYKTNGITHLFAISGMHISIIILILKKLKINDYLIIVILYLYSFLVLFTASVLRVTIFYTLKKVFKEISNVKLLIYTAIFLIIINHNIIYDIGFIYSFTITLGLFLLKPKNILTLSLYAFLLSLPISIYNNFEFNILSILINILVVPLVSLIIYPLLLLSLLFPFLSNIIVFLINIFEYINSILSNYSLNIIVRKISSIEIFIYYLILYIYIRKKSFKILGLLFILTISFLLLKYTNNSYYVYYLDVGQGDCEIIITPYLNKVIVIDTGGKVSYEKEEWKLRKSNYMISSNIILFLKSIGINKIDYLILTHGDYDHMGEAINLVNNFKVEKVIFNCGLFNDLEKELIKVLDKKKIKYYSCIKELNIDDNKLYFLQTKEYDNENDNSNVIYTEFNGYKFMFMGDASITTEEEILRKYNLTNIDVLKVGHHGSKTSSSKEFINEINPKYSIISVGKNNRYGHPNKEVLNNLEQSKIYRTDQDGSIMFKIKNNKLKIETCSP